MVGEWLADHGVGEMEGEDWHFPRYTHGCWGGRREPLCWVCKFRMIAALFSIVRRTKKLEEDDG